MSVLEAAERSVLRQGRGSGWVEQGEAGSMLECGAAGLCLCMPELVPRQAGAQQGSNLRNLQTQPHSPSGLPSSGGLQCLFFSSLSHVCGARVHGEVRGLRPLSLAAHPTVGDVFTEPRTCLSVRASSELAADSHLRPCTAAHIQACTAMPGF